VSIVPFALKKSVVVSVKVSNSPVVLLTMSFEGQIQPTAIAIQFSPITPVACKPFRTCFRKFFSEEGFEEASANALAHVFGASRTPGISMDHLVGCHPEVMIVLAAPEQLSL
jgi:hypothetical protein